MKEKKQAKLTDDTNLARALSEVLRKLDPAPDVILLQEIWSVAARDILKESLRETWPHAAHAPEVRLGDIAFQPSGLLLLSRHPLSDFRYHRFTQAIGLEFAANKGILGARLDIAGRPVAIFTTHLEAGNRQDPAVRASQLSECSAFMAEYTKADPQTLPILAGDFNIRSTEPDAYAAIFKNIPGFKDTFRAECSELQYTGRFSDEPTRRIDYFLVPDATRAYSIIIDPAGKTIADHHAILGYVAIE
ncbi:MAG: endonuclease/exonuclease/phosphatase family protein [Candidatus Hydrogenedentes bacterium]|nr:endonuclease/exonuclease/phosphatase family protein [Candidatus Hydrogenedentota bacterium]